MTTATKTKSDTMSPTDQDLIAAASLNWRQGQKRSVEFVAQLRTLQIRQVHETDGEHNFAQWASTHFDGLSSSNVKHMVRAGEVALRLEQSDRINFENPAVGTTGLRALSAILNRRNEEFMLAIFDTASKLRPGHNVTGDDVARACLAMKPSAVPDLEDDESFTIEEEKPPPDVDSEVDPALLDGIDIVHDRLWDLRTLSSKDEQIKLIVELKEVFDELLQIVTTIDVPDEEKVLTLTA